MNFAEMMMAGPGRNSDVETTLTHDQQITRLTEYFAQVYGQEPERFAPGQIIYHKNPGLADSRGAGDPILFVRYLPAPIALADNPNLEIDNFSGNIITKVVDCVSMRILGSKAPQHMTESRFYTATPPRA